MTLQDVMQIFNEVFPDYEASIEDDKVLYCPDLKLLVSLDLIENKALFNQSAVWALQGNAEVELNPILVREALVELKSNGLHITAPALFYGACDGQ